MPQTITNTAKLQCNQRTLKRYDGNYHIDNPESINDLYNLVGDKKGIYLMLAIDSSVFGATGHVTLWTGDASEEYVFGGHHYDESAKSMYFWELK